MALVAPTPIQLRSALLRLIARRPVPAGLQASAARWAQWSHRPLGRLSSAATVSVAFAASLLAYLLTGVVAFGIVALLMIVAFVVAMAVWGGARGWERTDRAERARVEMATAAAAARRARRADRARCADQRRVAALRLAAARRRSLVRVGLGLTGLWLAPELVLRLSRRRRR